MRVFHAGPLPALVSALPALSSPHTAARTQQSAPGSQS